MKHYLFILCFLMCFPGVAYMQPVAGGTGQTAGAKTKEPQIEEDLVHFGDLIDVDVVGGFEFDWRGTLTPEGFLAGLDGFGEPVYGLCRTERAIADDVAKAYSKILRDPKIVVRILDRSNRAVVRLDGAVKTPTRFRLKRAVRLRELIVLAGGLTDAANGEITIYRPKFLSCSRPDDGAPQGNGSQTVNIKISELLNGKAEADPAIFSGDMITIVPASPVYVIGAVNNPRPIYWRGEISVSRAIASAGGLAKDADGATVTIFRREGNETRVIEADLNKIKRGESEDELLKAFDILDVASKGGKRKYPPAAVSTGDKDRARAELPMRIVD